MKRLDLALNGALFAMGRTPDAISAPLDDRSGDRAFRQTRPANPADALVTEYKQAQSLLRRGALDSAKTLLFELCEASSRCCGPQHPSTLLYLDTLAATLVRAGDGEEAEALLSELLVLREQFSNAEDALTTVSTASVLVTRYLNQDYFSKGIPLQRRIVNILRKHRGEGDTETLLASSLLAVMFVEAGELLKARRLLQSICESFTHVLGRDHKETLRVFFLLGLVLEREGDLVGARAILERSFLIARSSLGDEDELSIRLGTKFGSLLLHSEQYAEAEVVLAELLPRSERVTGPYSQTTLANLANLSLALWGNGQHHLARTVVIELVRRRDLKLNGDEQAELKWSDADGGCYDWNMETGRTRSLQDERTPMADASVLRLRSFAMPYWKQ